LPIAIVVTRPSHANWMRNAVQTSQLNFSVERIIHSFSTVEGQTKKKTRWRADPDIPSQSGWGAEVAAILPYPSARYKLKSESFFLSCKLMLTNVCACLHLKLCHNFARQTARRSFLERLCICAHFLSMISYIWDESRRPAVSMRI
jgi:hypothetical protein